MCYVKNNDSCIGYLILSILIIDNSYKNNIFEDISPNLYESDIYSNLHQYILDNIEV